MNQRRDDVRIEDDAVPAPAPAVFGGQGTRGAPPAGDLAIDQADGGDTGDAARNAAEADPATQGRFDTAASNPNVISPPD